MYGWYVNGQLIKLDDNGLRDVLTPLFGIEYSF